MGGLVNSQTVKGDLWMIDLTNGQMQCYPIQTQGEGPGPRVGHSSLLVGNAFIVFGGDTKLEDGDVLDDTLYLLNTCEPLHSVCWTSINSLQHRKHGLEPRQTDKNRQVAMATH
jgi:hypothetical protein